MFFNMQATTVIYTLSLHDALPICARQQRARSHRRQPVAAPDPSLTLAHHRRRQSEAGATERGDGEQFAHVRSEEHTSELQSRLHLVCRLLLEKKKNKIKL